MIAAHLPSQPMMDAWSDDDPSLRMQVNFPIYAVTGAQACATVYFTLEPGSHVGRHTDSAEEIVVVLEGTVEASLGEERGTLETGAVALIPAMVPHDVRNVGDGPARILGFFAAATVESTFDDELQPLGTRVAGTPPAEVHAELMAAGETHR